MIIPSEVQARQRKTNIIICLFVESKRTIQMSFFFLKQKTEIDPHRNRHISMDIENKLMVTKGEKVGKVRIN